LKRLERVHGLVSGAGDLEDGAVAAAQIGDAVKIVVGVDRKVAGAVAGGAVDVYEGGECFVSGAREFEERARAAGSADGGCAVMRQRPINAGRRLRWCRFPLEFPTDVQSNPLTTGGLNKLPPASKTFEHWSSWPI
jgi:hypothetical protein